MLFACAPLLGQATTAASTPAAVSARTTAPAPQTNNSDIGFSYKLPAEWESVPEPPPPAPSPEVIANSKLATVKKGTACVQVAFTAKHGTPASVVVVVALPFACYGQVMTAGDLPDFGAGARRNSRRPSMLPQMQSRANTGWAAIACGLSARREPPGPPQSECTFEMVCTVLEKVAACWIAMAADDVGLQAFEQGAVSLDGEPATALVPASAFPAKP